MTAVKFLKGSPDVIEGLAIPFGGPFAGKDFDGEYFDATTDLCLEWFGDAGRPILYDHGTNGRVKTSVVGRQVGIEVTDDGVWVKAELDKNSQYRAIVAELIEAGGLSFSSGAMPHLVAKDRKSGLLTRWPWVELSLTPTPANPDAVVYAVKATDAIEHLQAVDTDIPEPLAEALKKLDEWAESRDGLPDGLSYAEHYDRVLVEAEALTARTVDITSMRAKVGRTISAANRARIAALRDRINESTAQARDVVKDLEDLLASTDPEAEKSALLAAVIEAELLLAQANGVSTR